MKELFLTIKSLLGQTSIKWIDLDKGQIDAYQHRPPVAFPCALVKIEFPNTTDLGGTSKVQQVNGRISVRLAFDYTGETSNVTPNAVIEKSLAYLDTVDEVYNKLQGFSSRMLTPFTRKSFKEETRADGLNVAQMIFETEFIDRSAAG